MVLIMRIIRFLLVFFAITMQSQEIPPIQIFTPQDYKAEDQNWGITQGQNNFIYVANNAGLLEYNGASWRLYNSPNDAILRSVTAVSNTVYTGGYMEFGYWTKNQFGTLVYTSLSQEMEVSTKEDEEFWNIVSIEDYILFQSFESIYIYNVNDQTIRVINSDDRINKVFKVKEVIYFQKRGVGVFKIENGIEVLVISQSTDSDVEVINIFHQDDGLLLQTKENGFYIFKNEKLLKWDIESNDLLSTVSIYNSCRLKNGSLVLGTIANGIIHLDENGQMLSRINQSDGLSNNTILSITEDSYGNVWLGLDNGINAINLKSPFKVFKDKQGKLGTVYASAKTDKYLYLGTNQGLFYKNLESKEKFKFVNGTKGQVWSLDLWKGVLFCGHDNGTYVINGDVADRIANEKGTWTIKEIKGRPNLLIQGNYKGLNILEFIDNKWRYRNKIKGFDISAKYFEFSDIDEILLSHEYKGVYKIKLDKNFEKVLNFERMPVREGVKSSILSYSDAILYVYRDGVFKYDFLSEEFKKDSLLSVLFSNEKYVSGKLINDQINNRIWGFSQDEIIYVEPGKLSDEPEINVIGVPSDIRSSKAGYENVLYVDTDTYLIGTTEGYLLVDLNKLGQRSNELYLNSVAYSSLQDELVPLNINLQAELKNNHNNVQFKYSTTNYNKLTASKYQYRLDGLYNNWSKWSTDSEIFFENLPHGDYMFEARAMTGGIISNNVLSYSFTVEKPLYLKPLAIVFYVLSAIIGAFLIHFLNKRYYKKQKEKLLDKKEREMELEQLESQRQLIEFKNKALELDIENKNRELGMATMNLVKRNELLNDIKVELAKNKSIKGEARDVIKLINSNLNNTRDWKLFEEAFNNVDKDFMKRVKLMHPSITPNDLRLCAYLRLNLSSKEIAPLLNISHKSVEVKRYRLRKKMGLEHDQSLSNYIVEL